MSETVGHFDPDNGPVLKYGGWDRVTDEAIAAEDEVRAAYSRSPDSEARARRRMAEALGLDLDAPTVGTELTHPWWSVSSWEGLASAHLAIECETWCPPPGRHRRIEPAWAMPHGTVYWADNIAKPGFIRVWKGKNDD